MKNKILCGHLAALMTILIWGTTFISTKVLLKTFTPIEILFFRFSIGYLALLLAYPHALKLTDRKQEKYFIFAGLTGVTLYFLLENIALTYSLASNVGVIISIAPFFISIFAHLLFKNEKLTIQFIIGFIVALSGIFLINFNGSVVLKLNPLGDILAVLAALVWAAYALLTKKISEFHYNSVQSTRRIFFYGLLFMIPALWIFDFKLGLTRLADPKQLANILFLGLLASALCFATWSFSVRAIGAIKTGVYIYLVPVVTVITSAIILKEQITPLAMLGAALTLGGLFISKRR